MTGLRFLALLVATGRMHGVGIGSSVFEVDEALGSGFIEEADEEGDPRRRDYGPLEMHFSGGDHDVVTGGVVEVHRLSGDAGIRTEARSELNVDFPEYTRWTELVQELEKTAGAPTLEISSHGEFLEYRAPGTKVSVHVVNNDEQRDEWPGQGDVWSVSLG
ncbi:hypothetical protein G3I19_03500 [Streptomyces sp. SID10853]|uniref:hypothetical protein n=1 Tax=Streptomyces sp. SID10853 TaxID=2706028 RepID=UPI0013BF5C6D|nr:hypothetical protein [Streptomyces sp. SID10853]NDZ77603.1 hypothetical protein [Streptomyces sp. SID10853]